MGIHYICYAEFLQTNIETSRSRGTNVPLSTGDFTSKLRRTTTFSQLLQTLAILGELRVNDVLNSTVGLPHVLQHTSRFIRTGYLPLCQPQNPQPHPGSLCLGPSEAELATRKPSSYCLPCPRSPEVAWSL